MLLWNGLPIRCSLGLHDWHTVYNDDPRIVQECSRCGRKRSTMYDMCYGSTGWVSGDHWGDEDERAAKPWWELLHPTTLTSGCISGNLLAKRLPDGTFKYTWSGGDIIAITTQMLGSDESGEIVKREGRRLAIGPYVMHAFAYNPAAESVLAWRVG